MEEVSRLIQDQCGVMRYSHVSLIGHELTQLREKTASLEDLLRMSRHTISTLQQKLRDLQTNYEKDLEGMQSQLDMFHKIVAEFQDEDGDEDGDIVIPRKDFAKAFGRIKAQESLEGKGPRESMEESNDQPKSPVCYDLLLLELYSNECIIGFIIQG